MEKAEMTSSAKERILSRAALAQNLRIVWIFNEGKQNFKTFQTWVQYHKTFYGCNLWMFVIG